MDRAADRIAGAADGGRMAAAGPLAVLLAALRLDRRTRVVDVGANPMAEEAPYAGLLRAGACDVVGFEPQPVAFAELAKVKSERETYFPFAVGDGSRKELRLYRDHGFASVLDPYLPGTKVMPLRGWHRLVEKIPFDTVALDAWPEVGPFDLLKIDIQGGECEVFRGARGALKGAVAVIVELRYFRLYEGEPMMGGVDCELRGQGFELHRFRFNKARALVNSQSHRLRHAHFRDQLIDGDAIYVRDITRLDEMTDAQLSHLAILASAVFASHSLALVCLDELARRGIAAADLPARYVDALPAEMRLDGAGAGLVEGVRTP
ncbi:MAG: FkbM family methyltransferase [Proteobacteria bacterium]|nr:FkbM family methyltransferase [Pseudomonadota bacterium]MBS0572517.1 FkbM family methyltransferase [Pseudomonadota bacterium]